jgi:DNA mismatch endonuclease (patch repair protein)
MLLLPNSGNSSSPQAKMADVHTREQRSRNMAAIRSKDTKPELIVRSLLHRMGHRFRLHRADLPGKPDVVFVRKKKVIFIHGCYWHMHRCRYGRVVPATNTSFWQTKRLSNVKRDQKNRRLLAKAGWDALTIWECWTKDEAGIRQRVGAFLA